MKKRVLAVLLAGVLSAAMLMACGDEETATTAEATTAEATTEESADATAETTGSELTFADLQDNYKTLVETYNVVEEAYLSDSIEQSDDVESLLTECKGVIDEMGELSEDDFNGESDLVTMNDSIVTLLEALGNIVDMMQETGDSSASASGLTFADLQENYGVLCETYQVVEDAYMNDLIEQDDTVESLLTEAKSVIDQMGELTEDDFTSESDYAEMNDAMLSVMEGLDGIVDLMQ